MKKEKLQIIRDEIVKYISQMDLDSDFSVIDRFEVMKNINNFLDPDNYVENIDILNKHVK